MVHQNKPYGSVGLTFLYHAPGKQVFVHHRGREQLVPAVQRPGRQKRPCGAFLERGRVPGEVPHQQHAAGVEPCGNAGLFFCLRHPGTLRTDGAPSGTRTACAGRLTSRPAKTPLRGVFRARESPRGTFRLAARCTIQRKSERTSF